MFSSDDEGNTANYFVQRYMEVDRDQNFSPEQYENMINSSKEFEQKSRFFTRHSSKFIEEEIKMYILMQIFNHVFIKVLFQFNVAKNKIET